MNSGGLMPFAGLLCPLLFIGFVVVVIILMIRTVRAGTRRSVSLGAPAPAPVNIPTQLSGDGFWIISCPADAGSMIYYHYWSAGTRYSGQVPFKPEADGRQFIYTGRKPEQVSIIRIVEVDDDDGLSGSTIIPPMIVGGPVWDLPSASSSPPQSSSSSFPSAY